MNRLWTRALPGLIALALLPAAAGTARAAAEVHRFNLVISAYPTSIAGGDFNDVIDSINKVNLVPRGFESLNEITYGWMFQGELRYFLRQNFAVCAGVGQLRSMTSREYTFGVSDDITVRAEMLSVPINVGGDYYFTPYNQGDFQARAYVGGGILSLTNTYGRIATVAISSTPGQGGTFTTRYAGDAPGWYAEVGAHMFFAVRYSVMLGAIYRSAQAQYVGVYSSQVGTTTYPDARLVATNVPFTLDTSGLGARMSVAIGF
ncbi:MAG TPA: hypothetical protein VI792_07245 [Candidatus Eisenbacteria bacterium]